VAAREGNMLAVAFHAELTDDDRLHRLFLDGIRSLTSP
jgi:pyridoxal 5'-phosphate synthase pdxT subunit